MSRPQCPTPHKAAYNHKFEAKLGAKRAARKVIAQGGHFEPLHVYECPCGRWHLTSWAEYQGEPAELAWSVPDALQEWARTGEMPE